MPDPEEKSHRDYASAAEAMALLGVRRQTLYAYVSRGWIRSVPQRGLKDKLYLREDLKRVGMRSLARSGHGAVAASAMNWGEPIFPTSITEITAQGPRYRDHLASDLVRGGASFEAVAGLLWSGSLPARHGPWPVRTSPAELVKLTRIMVALRAGNTILEAFALVILLLGLGRGPVAERIAGGRTLPAAMEIIQTLVGCCGFASPAGVYRPMRQGQSVVEGLMHALQVPATPANADAFRSMLILLADHELSPGTLSARVVASAGGTLHSCLAAALCATSGVDVGRMYERVENFLGQTQSSTVLLRRARQLHAVGHMVPGFGHPLYPKGDPRAVQLLELARSREQQEPQLKAVLRFLDQMQAEFSLFPRQEMAVVVLAHAMGLKRQVPAALFALGRIAGWVAHVREQRASGSLLRPRAKFVKPPST
ncbi:MAG: citrate synthase [Polaromonas sp.]|nr:citrate synthase [Polaromonas sp.]